LFSFLGIFVCGGTEERSPRANEEEKERKQQALTFEEHRSEIRKLHQFLQYPFPCQTY
jgi:hypothetical protein